MEIKSIKGLTLFFDPEEQEAAEIIAHACEKTVPLINECWRLENPEDCRIYVMTSMLRFVFLSAPWYRRILLGAFIPLWYFRAKEKWPISGGWNVPYKKRPAVGVKPSRLLKKIDSSLGSRVFIKEDDIGQRIQNITCHELVHAFSTHLRLPMWLNEGLAMVTVDRYFGKPTVKHETIEILGNWSQKTSPARYRKLTVKDKDALVYHFVRGYWITRYIEETQPELLKNLLLQRYSKRTLESKVANALGMTNEEFWSKIDGIVAFHFSRSSLFVSSKKS